jgi:CheY-like chemotaxis protein
MDLIPETPAQILVIDDNHGEVQELRDALTECGEPYELSVLQDGEAALRFVADHRSGLRRPEPCVIVLDLNLPKHDALAVLAAIRSEPALSHIRVLVVSTLAVPETQALLRAMGGLYRERPRDLPGLHDMAVQLLALCNKRLTGVYGESSDGLLAAGSAPRARS